ncbi:unnamed protein product [Acanthoscelides obtectus]|uniref:BMP and activin membrane-bound inhibitor n=1 Tax=Acanthoscelides obtectus TaxID=200917 RepID=A0A9P0KM47_ACAOB|nr:unnamed protein product [Acanthoscelides obtectus]CAK1622097.1 BMP and activin membrane-bound inhibitor homolog [Acanthoscelides obtectus]
MGAFGVVFGFSVIFSYRFALVLAGGEGITINKPVVRSSRLQAQFATGYVSCFCNLASCVTTGYVCKSVKGGCFSDISDQNSNGHKGHHGCIEQLPEEESAKCQTRGGMHERTVIRRKESPRSLFLCCHHDLCNHVDSPQTKSLLNTTLLSDISEEQDLRYQNQQETTYLYSDSDVWFRAATIAVPICGAVILFVLIALAVKILKSEHQDSAVHKLGPTMYVHHLPQQCKTLKDYPDRYDKAAYDNLLRKDYIPTHHNFLIDESASRAHQQPLLAHPSAVGPPPCAYVPILAPSPCVSNAHSNASDKNETNAKLNLMQCESDSKKSIIFEIEKAPTNCSEVNLVTFTPEKSS